jgi:CheY-like chemotaxis protein
LHVLLTEDYPPAPQRWTHQLLRLLEPQGVAAYVARTGREAIQMAEQFEIHAAVIDLSTPLDVNTPNNPTVFPSTTPSPAANFWLLELFRRLPNKPPVVVVRGPMYNQRQVEQLLREALRLGVFSVVNKPVELEQILTVFQRLLDRQYQGSWPRVTRNPNTTNDS